MNEKQQLTYRYAYQKFPQAVDILATEPGDVRKRLLMVFNGPLQGIKEKDLPEYLREDWSWVEKEITKYDEPYKGHNDYYEKAYGYPIQECRFFVGSIESTLRRIKNKTGAKIAEKIYHIYLEINDIMGQL